MRFVLPGCKNPAMRQQLIESAHRMGTSVGLFISALAESEDQASTLVPIALIPQILLGGVVVPKLSRVPEFVAHKAISGYWVSSSLGALGDHAPVPRAIVVLAAHMLFFWAASWWVLYRRERNT
jgi:ABC-2 type transport system permease protein